MYILLLYIHIAIALLSSQEFDVDLSVRDSLFRPARTLIFKLTTE